MTGRRLALTSRFDGEASRPIQRFLTLNFQADVKEGADELIFHRGLIVIDQ